MQLSDLHGTVQVSSLQEAFMNYVSNNKITEPAAYNTAEQAYFLGAAAALGLTAILAASVMQKNRQLTPNDVAGIIQGFIAEAAQLVADSDERQSGAK